MTCGRKVLLKGLILFGDSVLFGTGASSRDKGCGKLLRKIINVPVLIKSRNRDTTEDALNRINHDVIEFTDYSHVVILFGNNDCRLKDINTPIISLDKYRTNLVSIIKKIQSNHKTPLLCNLQPIESYGFFKSLPQMVGLINNLNSTPYLWQKKYSDTCEEVSKKTDIKLVDIRSPLEKNIKEILADDGLHPNDTGHQIIAKCLSQIIKLYDLNN